MSTQNSQNGTDNNCETGTYLLVPHFSAVLKRPLEGGRALVAHVLQLRVERGVARREVRHDVFVVHNSVCGGHKRIVLLGKRVVADARLACTPHPNHTAAKE